MQKLSGMIAKLSKTGAENAGKVNTEFQFAETPDLI